MTDIPTDDHAASGRTDDTGQPHPAGRPRLLPTATFGLRAAALASVATPVGMMAMGMLSGSPAMGMETTDSGFNITCCVEEP